MKFEFTKLTIQIPDWLIVCLIVLSVIYLALSSAEAYYKLRILKLKLSARDGEDK
jgi:hypothetical protein